MPKFLERKLKIQYGANSPIPYKILNKIGAMSGPNETEKGEDMQKAHERGISLRKLLRAGKVSR